jgi:Tol biopolymer transport system component
VSVDSAGIQGNDDSAFPSISFDGRFVAFASFATNLVPGDTNATTDYFVRDRQTGTTERVSVDSAGAQGNGVSGNDSVPSVSSDGRYVVFDSWSSNLVPADTNGDRDVFVRDRQTGTTERVSVDSAGGQGDGDSGTPNSHSSGRHVISSNGRYVVFQSFADDLVPGDINGAWDIFLRDRLLDTTMRVSDATPAPQNSNAPSISDDGRFVAYHSEAVNLVPGDTNGYQDVFVYDRLNGTTRRMSSSPGVQGNQNSLNPSVSHHGGLLYVAFVSLASNLVPSDTNGDWDVFLRQTMEER